MRVLVTGHLGYIGSVLVPVFQAAGHEVVGLDSDLYRGCTFGDRPRVPAVPRVDARPPRRRGRAARRASTRSSTSPRCRTTRWATSTRA